jgi:hypothetical protein
MRDPRTYKLLYSMKLNVLSVICNDLYVATGAAFLLIPPALDEYVRQAPVLIISLSSYLCWSQWQCHYKPHFFHASLTPSTGT